MTDTTPQPLTPADIEYLVESRVGMEIAMNSSSVERAEARPLAGLQGSTSLDMDCPDCGDPMTERVDRTEDGPEHVAVCATCMTVWGMEP